MIERPRRLPVFPLPNTVFFPGTSLPLHVFEPRYRTMVHDVMADDRLIVVALMRADQSFHDVGTVGRVEDLEPMPDGRFDLRLEGLQRLRVVEVERDSPYRQVEARPLPERPATAVAAAQEQAKLELIASLSALRSMVQPGQHETIASGDIPLEIVVNTACAGLPIAAHLRQELLEESDLWERQKQASEHMTSMLDAVARLMYGQDGDDTQLVN